MQLTFRLAQPVDDRARPLPSRASHRHRQHPHLLPHVLRRVLHQIEQAIAASRSAVPVPPRCGMRSPIARASPSARNARRPGRTEGEQLQHVEQRAPRRRSAPDTNADARSALARPEQPPRLIQRHLPASPIVLRDTTAPPGGHQRRQVPALTDARRESVRSHQNRSCQTEIARGSEKEESEGGRKSSKGPEVRHARSSSGTPDVLSITHPSDR